MARRFILKSCFVIVALIKVCGCYLPDGMECPAEALIHSESVRPEVGRGPVCGCEKRWCLPLCCPIGSYLTPEDHKTCINEENLTSPDLPPHHDHESLEERSEKFRNDHFHHFTWNPCREKAAYYLDPENDILDSFKLLTNGSIYVPDLGLDKSKYVHINEFCLGAYYNRTVYQPVMCDADYDEAEINDICIRHNDKNPHRPIYVQYVMIASVPFFMVTFVVYSIIPELRNMHGATLRAYVAVSAVRDIHLLIVNLVPAEDINEHVCIILAYVIYFFAVASFFWLNVMCFDIWWTFGGFRSYNGSLNQRERKKFIIYSAYAWGSSLFMTGICMIMNLVPNLPCSWIIPEFGVSSCWFRTDAAKTLYLYVPAGSTVVCNMCLFVLTTIKILQHKKAMAHDLNGMDSRCHDVNKQWLILYFKLFAVMGINWSMEILNWVLRNDTPKGLWVLPDVINSLQGIIIFVMFVCKRKIKMLVLKRLGCRDRKFKGSNSTKSSYQSSTSRTSTCTSIVMVPLPENSRLYSERMQYTTDDSDC